MPSLQLQRWLVEEARARGLMCVAHCTSVRGTIDLLLRAGVDGMAHTIVDAPPTAELIEAYKLRGALATNLTPLTPPFPLGAVRGGKRRGKEGCGLTRHH